MANDQGPKQRAREKVAADYGVSADKVAFKDNGDIVIDQSAGEPEIVGYWS